MCVKLASLTSVMTPRIMMIVPQSRTTVVYPSNCIPPSRTSRAKMINGSNELPVRFAVTA